MQDMLDFDEYFIMRDENAPNHWRRGLSSWFKNTGKKKILVLPGGACNSPKSANGMCKRIQKILGPNLAKQCEVYCVWYPNSNKDSNTIALRTMQIFDTLFVPMMAQKNPLHELEKLPKEQVMQNFQNTICMTHCYGSYILETLDKHIYETLCELNYSTDESQKIARQLWCVHNNNLSVNVGQQKFYASHLQRMSQSDEKRNAGDYELGTFQHEIRAEKLAPDDLLYIKVSDNERALLLAKVTENGNDHNGGYWSDCKTPTALKEELFVQALLEQRIKSKDKSASMDDYLQVIAKQSDFYDKTIRQMCQNGAEFADEYHDYVANIQSEFADIKAQILQKSLNESTAENISYEALLYKDDEGKMLIDHAFEKSDAKQIQLIWQNLKECLTEEQPDGQKQVWANLNEKEAIKKHYILLEKAMQNNNVQVFTALFDDDCDLSKLDYSNIGTAVLPVLVNRLIAESADKPKDVNNFYDYAVRIYAAASNSLEQQKKLEKTIFDAKNIETASQMRIISNCCRKYKIAMPHLNIGSHAGINFMQLASQNRKIY